MSRSSEARDNVTKVLSNLLTKFMRDQALSTVISGMKPQVLPHTLLNGLPIRRFFLGVDLCKRTGEAQYMIRSAFSSKSEPFVSVQIKAQ